MPAADKEEPSVVVDPMLEAFGVVRSRIARGTLPPRPPESGRLSLAMIEQFLRENADESSAEG